MMGYATTIGNSLGEVLSRTMQEVQDNGDGFSGIVNRVRDLINRIVEAFNKEYAYIKEEMIGFDAQMNLDQKLIANETDYWNPLEIDKRIITYGKVKVYFNAFKTFFLDSLYKFPKGGRVTSLRFDVYNEMQQIFDGTLERAEGYNNLCMVYIYRALRALKSKIFKLMGADTIKLVENLLRHDQKEIILNLLGMRPRFCESKDSLSKLAADHYMTIGRVDDALEFVSEIVDMNEGEDYQRACFHKYLELGEIDKAVKVMNAQEVLEGDVYLLPLCKKCLEIGRVDDALDFVKSAIKEDTRIDIMLDCFDKYLEAGKIDKAIEVMDLQEDLDDDVYLFRLCRKYLELGQMKQAVLCLKDLDLMESVFRDDALNIISQEYTKRGKIALAMKYAEAMRSQGHYNDAMLAISLKYGSLGKIKNAVFFAKKITNRLLSDRALKEVVESACNVASRNLDGLIDIDEPSRLANLLHMIDMDEPSRLANKLPRASS